MRTSNFKEKQIDKLKGSITKEDLANPIFNKVISQMAENPQEEKMAKKKIKKMLD